MPIKELGDTLQKLIAAAEAMLRNPGLEHPSKEELLTLCDATITELKAPSSSGIAGREISTLAFALCEIAVAQSAGYDEGVLRWSQLAGSLLPWVKADAYKAMVAARTVHASEAPNYRKGDR